MHGFPLSNFVHRFSLDYCHTFRGQLWRKKTNYQIWMTIESFWTVFHMNGGVLGFLRQLRPTKMLFKHSVCSYQKVSETGVPLKLKIKVTSFSDIFWLSELDCFRKTCGTCTFLGFVVLNCTPASVHLYCRTWRQPGLRIDVDADIYSEQWEPSNIIQITNHCLEF